MNKTMPLAAALLSLSAGAALAQGMPNALLQANQLHPQSAFIEPLGPDSSPSQWISRLFGANDSANAARKPERNAALRDRAHVARD